MKYMSHLYLSSAMTDDALYTITRPKQTIATTVKNRIQSVFRRCATLQTPHQFLEHTPPVLKVIELIETGACGGQQNDIPGNRPGSRPIYRLIDGARLHQGQPFQLRCDLRRGGADQHHGFCLLPELF